MKVLKFSYELNANARTGRELLAEINGNALSEICGPRLSTFTIVAERAGRRISSRLRALMGWLDGLSRERADECADLIVRQQIDVVYIEGSNYGRLARVIRSRAPECRIITFFHNVESRFFWGALRSRPSLKALGVLFANWLAERDAVRYSDRIICLNERDSQLLRRIYGRAATDIHPMCVAAPAEQPPCKAPGSMGETFGLFVGGAFYANLEGIRWFARNVSDRVPCKIVVVGKGFEAYREELGAYGNLSIVGTVDSLESWYTRSAFVIAPIFDGSGMKTKVAEALMFGRPVIGTAEAFVGYENIADAAGVLCNDADSFVEAIAEISSGRRKFDADRLRVLYQEGYSFDAKTHRFKATLAALAEDKR